MQQKQEEFVYTHQVMVLLEEDPYIRQYPEAEKKTISEIQSINWEDILLQLYQIYLVMETLKKKKLKLRCRGATLLIL